MTTTLPIEPTTDSEAARMAAVRRYDVLDTPPDGAFDRITQLAARFLGVPISIVSIVDTDRIWFKSHEGIDAEETGRDPGLCASAILQEDAYVVTDAKNDPRTLANPLVAGSLGLQFYAGIPLVTHDGHKLGTLCAIDVKPRQVSKDEIGTLTNLASVVMDELELRLSAKRLHELETAQTESFQKLAESLEAGLMSNRAIGKALGLIMANYDLTDAEAFKKLKHHSQDLNMKLQAIADEIVANHNRA